MTVFDPLWLAWIAGFVLCARASPSAVRPFAMAGLTLVFIAETDIVSAIILTAMTLVTSRFGLRAGAGFAVIGTVIATFLGALAAFKLTRNDELGVVMPLGMSYYTFRCIHYLLERLKQRLPPHSFAEFLSYMFFMPALTAGPIHRFGQFHRDLRRPHPLSSQVSEGLERVLYGYAKIVILANFVVEQLMRDASASLTEAAPRASAYIDMLAGGFNGYLQFAGYSDIVIGVALLSGFRIIENFNNPLAARNIIEFWQRWHISLTSWVREYLYTSVFSLTRRPYFAALLTMLAIGLWHEISWRYVIWGLAHGLAVAGCQLYRKIRAKPATTRFGSTAVAWFATFHFVMLSFVLVQHDFSGALAVYRLLILGAG